MTIAGSPAVEVEVAYLADRQECVAVLARWFVKEWPDYYTGWTAAEVEASLWGEMNRDTIPVRLVATVCGEVVGTVVVRERALGVLAAFTPGLGGLFVAEGWRRRGVGSALVRAATGVARRLGHAELFAATSPSTGGAMLERLSWQRVASVIHGTELLGVYRCEPAGT